MARSRSSFRTIIIAGVIAGTFDIVEAILFFGMRSRISAERVLQSIASGLFGRSAYAGGWVLALFGLALHFSIAIGWAAVFVFFARYVPVMRQHAVPAGLVFGFVVYAIMNLVVVPHTRAVPQPSHVPIVVFNAICAIVFLVGLPIALTYRKLG